MTYFVAAITTNYISATTPLSSVRAPEECRKSVRCRRNEA